MGLEGWAHCHILNHLVSRVQRWLGKGSRLLRHKWGRAWEDGWMFLVRLLPMFNNRGVMGASLQYGHLQKGNSHLKIFGRTSPMRQRRHRRRG